MLHAHAGYGIADMLMLLEDDYEAFDAVWDAVFGREPDGVDAFVARRERGRAGRLGGLFARMRKR